jgi:hypothetical protein
VKLAARTFLLSPVTQFLFAGYSWRSKDFRIWTINFSEKSRIFTAREAEFFHPRLRKAAFIGDWATRMRSRIAKDIAIHPGKHLYLEPLATLSDLITKATDRDTIGGAPQLVRITQHMTTRPLCVRWRDKDTLFGRPLFDYENVDFWIVDPFTGKFRRPRKFGNRMEKETDATSAKYASNAKIFDLEKANILAGFKKAFDAEAKRHLILAP